MNPKLFLAVSAIFLSIASWSQTAVRGRVIDSRTEKPIEGAAIRIDDQLGGTVTDNKGFFTITNLPEGEHTLRISHIQYLPLQITAQYDREMCIRMEENRINIGQVVVTGTGTHHRMADTPVPVSVITSSDIQESNATTLEEVLTKLNPAFSFSTNGMGTTMTLNGVNQDYVLILVNGKKMAGEDTYSRINIDRIKRIETLNGAASALYGSDAIGGVVNIITDEPKNIIDVSSNTRISSHQRISESAHATLSGEKFASYTNYKYQQAGNWQLNPVDEKGLITGKMTSTGYRSHNADQKFTYSPSKSLTINARGSYYNYRTDRPDSSMSQDPKHPEKYKPAYTYDILHESYLYGAGAKYIIRKGSFLEADFFSDNYTAQKNYFGNDKHEKDERSLDKKTHYYDANVRGIFSLPYRNKLSAGVEYIYESLLSEKSRSSNPIDENMYTVALYAQDEWKIGKGFSAVAGVRYLYHKLFRSYATPNVSVMYQYKGFNARLAYAGGFRTPDLAQIYTSSESTTSSKLTLPNTGLKPEKSNYYALNLEYTHSRFSIGATGYLNDIRDMIHYRILSREEAESMGLGEYSEVKQRDNIGRARIWGVNVSANAYLGAGFSLNAGYAYNHPWNLSENSPIDKTIEHSGTVNASWDHTWNFYTLDISINGRLQSERYSELYQPAPAFTLWSLNTSHTFVLDHVILKPSIGIDNIFNYKDDRPWNNNFATLTPGRAVYASLIISFTR